MMQFGQSTSWRGLALHAPSMVQRVEARGGTPAPRVLVAALSAHAPGSSGSSRLRGALRRPGASPAGLGCVGVWARLPLMNPLISFGPRLCIHVLRWVWRHPPRRQPGPDLCAAPFLGVDVSRDGPWCVTRGPRSQRRPGWETTNACRFFKALGWLDDTTRSLQVHGPLVSSGLLA